MPALCFDLNVFALADSCCHETVKVGKLKSKMKTMISNRYYRAMTTISVNIVPRWGIEGHELGPVYRYPSEGQYSPISV